METTKINQNAKKKLANYINLGLWLAIGVGREEISKGNIQHLHKQLSHYNSHNNLRVPTAVVHTHILLEDNML